MGIIANFEAWRNAWASIDLADEASDIATDDDNERKIADKNREQLYEHGEDATGKKLKRYRNNKYARVKHQMNAKPGEGTPDFFVTGEFHRSIFTDVRGKTVIMDASDRKVEFLVKRDGEGIFGLQDESKTEVWVEILRAPLIQRIKFKTQAL